MKDNYYLDIILKGYEKSSRAIQFEETFATFESHSTVLNMGSTKYSDAEFYQIWINSDPIKTLIARIGKDEFISNEAKSRVQVEAWGILANYFDSQQKTTEREYFITNTDFFKNCLNTIDKLILNLKKIDGNTESIFYYEGVQGSLTDKAGKGFPYCNEINSFVFIRWHIKNTLKNAYKIEQDLLTPQKPQQLETSTTKQKYTPKPCFNPKSIESITEDLNTFFDPSQYPELKRIIETGSNTTEKLLFRDNSNKLSDYFKRLYENHTITGCDKKDLINWIVKNFKYIHRKTEKHFIPKTVEKTISGTGQPCKNPIT